MYGRRSARLSGSFTREPLTNNRYLIWLEWPEKCFRVTAEALRHLQTLVPGGAAIVRVRSERAFLRELPTATHVVTWNFSSDWFVRAPQLKLLATPAAGHEFVPTQGPEGVQIHFGGYHGQFMSESVAAFLLAWCRGFFLRQPSSWPRTWMSDRCRELAGTKAVILGYGKVGRAIGEKLSALGVKVAGITRHNRGFLRLAKGLPPYANPDWLICALPGDSGTDKLVNAQLIAKLPRTCVVVNVGRGNVIDENALFSALRTKRLAGAYLDVRASEPVAKLGNALPKIPEGLDTLVLMPHASAFSPNYIARCFDELAQEGLLK